MNQLSFSDIEFDAKRKQTRCDKFLAGMDKVVPWAGLSAVIEPVYPKGPKAKVAVLRTRLRRCFGFTSCNSGLR